MCRGQRSGCCCSFVGDPQAPFPPRSFPTRQSSSNNPVRSSVLNLHVHLLLHLHLHLPTSSPTFYSSNCVAVAAGYAVAFRHLRPSPCLLLDTPSFYSTSGAPATHHFASPQFHRPRTSSAYEHPLLDNRPIRQKKEFGFKWLPGIIYIPFRIAFQQLAYAPLHVPDFTLALERLQYKEKVLGLVPQPFYLTHAGRIIYISTNISFIHHGEDA